MTIACQDLHTESESSSADLLEDFAVSAPCTTAAVMPTVLGSFGTKSDTLAALQPLVKKAAVPKLISFTVAEWSALPVEITQEINERFGGGQVVFRSSAVNEDGEQHSQAGAFASCLDVDSSQPRAVWSAVEEVIGSMDDCPENQVLVMTMVTDVTLSGVIMTHELDTGAPYYVLNYDDETGKTDTITGGSVVNKTVLVHRDYVTDHVDSPRVAELLELTRELESLCDRGTPLDIEFAKTRDGQLHLLQVRRITVQENWNRRISRHVGEVLFQAGEFFTRHAQPHAGLAGARTILGQMPDWNPAEIIGTRPRPLAVSLYRHLITDSIWQEARAEMGYQPVPHTPLMLTLGGQPYIDVRASFNSFLPAGLPIKTRERLVDAWLDRLEANPKLHDKVEFEVAQTVLDFNFDEDFQNRYDDVLEPDEYLDYRNQLSKLTATNLSLVPGASLPVALEKIHQLEALQTQRRPLNDLAHLPVLLEECRALGTRPFSVIARHAFMAEAILRSAVTRDALSGKRLVAFKRTLRTVTADFTGDFAEALTQPRRRPEFLAKYGHLRPGTYDITSPRYDQRDDLFAATAQPEPATSDAIFPLTREEAQLFQELFSEAGMPDVEPGQFIEYARQAITHLTVQDLLNHLVSPVLNDPELYFEDLVEQRRREQENVDGIRLGYLIRDPGDFYVVPLHRSAPNFVGNRHVEGEPLRLGNQSRGHSQLSGRIICIENADPGFDWIFTRNIAGLVSKFGGANSHMTIRCAELGLPAAIGVGEQTFERIAAANRVELDGAAKLLRPIYG
jgi:phosphohistidine swiveling domain-containing protein